MSAPDIGAAEFRPVDFAVAFSASANFTSDPIVFNGALEEIRRDMDSHYPLGEESGTRFDFVGSDDLEPNGTVNRASAKIGDGADFEESNPGALEAADVSVHQVGNKNWTASLWFTIETTGTTGAILSKTTLTPSPDGSFQLQYLQSPTNRLRWIVFSDGSTATIATANNFGAVPTGTLVHVLVYHDADNDEIGIRVNNGTPNTASFSGGIFEGDALFRIGAHGDDETAGPPPDITTFHDGIVDEVTIWSRLLSESEQAAIYASGAGTDLTEVRFTCYFDALAEFDASIGTNDVEVQLRAEPEFSASLTVLETRELSSSFEADADFGVLEAVIDDERDLSLSLSADADFLLDLDVDGYTFEEVASDLQADADFSALLRVDEALGEIADQLRHYYRGEESSGQEMSDVRGGFGDLDVGTLPGSATGKIGNARDFVRASNQDATTDNNELWYFDGDHDFTVTCWTAVDTGAMSGDGAVWGRFDGPGSDRGPLLFYDTSAGTLRFVMSLNGSANEADLEPALTLTGGVLYFLEVTYDSSTRLLTFRINRGSGATFEDSATIGAGTWFKTAINFHVGDATGTGNTHLDGRVDELTLHGRLLSSAELDAMYNDGAARNIAALLDRDLSFSFQVDASFQQELTLVDLAIDFEADADFTVDINTDTRLACTVTVDASFSETLNVDRDMAFDFVAELTEVTLSVERPLSFSFEALANFQSDPLDVFDALQVGVDIDADFAGDLAVIIEVIFAVDFQADADFVQLLEITDRLVRFDFFADADFTTSSENFERRLSFSFQADADFLADLRSSRVTLMQTFAADADFQAVFGFENLALKVAMTAAAEFEIKLFVAEHDGYVNDLLGITDQIGAAAARLQISGVDETKYQFTSQWDTVTPQDDTFLESLAPNPGAFAEPTFPARAAYPARIHHAWENSLLGPGGDWFGRVFVLPSRVDLGFVITDVSVPMVIYSSYVTATRSLDSVVNNVDLGLSLGSFPILPETILPQSGFSFTADITAVGSPSISGTLDFTFDVGFVAVPFTGQRTLLFSPPPVLPIRETLRSKTVVLTKRVESEQRFSSRVAPRQEFIYQYELEGFDRQCLEALIFDAHARVVGVPIWWEPMRLTSALSAADTVINVEQTAYRDIRVGGLVAIWSSTKDVEVAQVAFVTATTITLSTQLIFDHDTNSLVYPVRLSTLEPVIRGSKLPVNLQRTRIRFIVTENDTSLADDSSFPTFDSRVLLSDPNWIDNELPETYERRLITIDNETGVFEVTSHADIDRRGHTKTFHARTYQQVWEIRQLVHALRGEQVAFYIPTFFDEFVLTDDIGAGDDFFTFQNFGFTKFIQQRQPRNAVRLVLKDGTTVARFITASIELSTDEERCSVDSPWGVNGLVDDVERIEYLTKVRLASDDVQIDHIDALGQARVRVPVREVLD